MLKELLKNKARIAVLIAFLVNGVFIATWVSRIPAIQAKLALSEGALGLVLVGLTSGLVSALFFASGLIARLGSRKVVLVCASIASAVMPLLAIAPHPLVLFMLLFIFGACISTMDVSMNEQAVLVERAAGVPMMSSFHAAYSVGGFVGALIASGMAAVAQFTPFIHFLTAGLLSATAIFFFGKDLLPTETNAERQDGSPIRLPAQALWLLGMIVLTSSIGEGTSSDWSAVYLTGMLDANASVAALGYAAFSLTMTAGRLAGDRLAAVMPAKRIIRLGGVLSSLGFILAALTKAPALAILGFALTGAGLANIVPLVFSAAGNKPGIKPGEGIAGVATIGYIGFLAGPPIIGSIAELASLRVSFLFAAVVLATLIFSASAIEE